MIAVGLGCRKQCTLADLLAALELALARDGVARAELSGLYAPELKRGEPALSELALLLEKPLRLLPLALLQAEEPHLLSPSERVRSLVGVSSVSESAALAGARSLCAAAPRLRRARSIVGGATCALAFAEPVALTRALTRNEP